MNHPAVTRQKRCISPDASTELIDLADLSSLPRHIDIISRQIYGAVTIGRYCLRSNPGAFLGITQYAIIVQEGDPFEMDWLVSEADLIESRLMQPNDVSIYPADTLVYKKWDRSSRMLFMAIERDFIEQVLHDAFGQWAAPLRLRIGIRDPVIEGMAKAWRDELYEQGAGGQIHAEALATALIVHLARTYTERESKVYTVTGGMNGLRLRRVIDYIEGHLAEDVSLSTLASVAGISVHHFNYAFKAEIGTAPHRFVVRRRIHRAKEMLLGTDLPIADIALAVGFSSQSHLTLKFRKLTGTTPMRFRIAGKA